MLRLFSSLAILSVAIAGYPSFGFAQTNLRVTAAPAGWAPMFEELAAEFETQHPDVKIKIESQNRNFEALTEQTLREAIIGDLPDISITGSNQIQAFVERDLAVDLGGYIATDPEWRRIKYSSAAADTGQINGHQYALTLAASMPVIIYNKELVTGAGSDPEVFPDAWPEIIELGKKVTALEPDTTGLFFEHDSNGNWTYLALIESAGGKMATSTNEVAFDGEEGLWALNVIHDIGEAGQAHADMSRDQARQAFVAGRVGALVTSSSNIGNFKKQIAGKFQIGIAAFPVPSTDGRLPVAGLSAIIFSKDQAKADAAWKFLRFAMQPASQMIIVQSTGMVPLNDHAIGDPKTLGKFYSEEPLFAAALKNRNLATSWYAFPGPNSIKIFSVIKDTL